MPSQTPPPTPRLHVTPCPRPLVLPVSWVTRTAPSPAPHAASGVQSPTPAEAPSLSLPRELPPQELPKLHTPTFSENKPQGRGWTSCLCTENLSVPRTSEASCPQVGLASPHCAELCTPTPTPQEPSPASLLGLHLLSLLTSSLSVETPSPPVSPTSALGRQTLPSASASRAGRPVTGRVCRRREPTLVPRSLRLLCSSAPRCLANPCGTPSVTRTTHPEGALCAACVAWDGCFCLFGACMLSRFSGV